MNQDEFFKQLKVTVELLGFNCKLWERTTFAICSEGTKLWYLCVRIETDPKAYVLDTLYDENFNLGLPTGITEYTLDQLPELLQVITQYLVSILEASKKQNKPI